MAALFCKTDSSLMPTMAPYPAPPTQGRGRTRGAGVLYPCCIVSRALPLVLATTREDRSQVHGSHPPPVNLRGGLDQVIESNVGREVALCMDTLCGYSVPQTSLILVKEFGDNASSQPNIFVMFSIILPLQNQNLVKSAEGQLLL